MSKEIDNQIVQMTFDNKQFEKNAAQTISTIDKLKMSLQFKGVSEGLKEVSKAIASFPVKSIGVAADTVTNKFSAMGTAVDQLIRNTERRLEAFAMNAVNTLNVFKGGLTAGFSEYETQINAVQTIWANTKDAGTEMEDITRILDELNEYADKTIYNFTEMTRNIGTFTAAGVGLEESSKAIQGIANLAAVSGSTSQQAATAMYQLSQALSAGKVSLMDWNSVVTAGMGGKMFRDVLAETAEELGTINSQFAKGLKDGSINFRETLTKEGWITSEVLTAALTKFTDTSTELGRMATDAATKVKTFTQLLSTLKESVQSGWTQSWEYIIGDFESARNLFTELSNKIQSLIQPSMDARNKMLAYWSGANKANEEAEKNLKAQEKHQNEIEALAKRVIANEFGVGQARYDALDALGYDHREVQNAVQHMLGLADAFVIEAEAAEESDKSTKKTFDQMSGREHVLAGLVNIGNALGEVLHFVKLAFTDVFPPITGAQLVYISKKFHEFTETLDLNRDQLKKMRSALKGLFSIFKIAGKLFSSIFSGISSAISEMLPNSGNVLTTLSDIGTAITDLSDSFDKEDLWGGITEATKKFVKYISKAVMNAKDYILGLFKMKPSDAISKVIDDLTEALKSLFSTTDDSGDKTSGLQSVLNTIKYFIDETNKVVKAGIPNIQAITNALGKFWEVIKGDELLSAWNPIDFLIALGNTLKRIVSNLTVEEIGGMGLALLMGEISKFFKNLSAFVKSITNPVASISNPFAKAINDLRAIAQSLPGLIITFTASTAALIGMVIWLSTIESEKAKSAVAMMSIIMAELVIAMIAFKKLQKVDPETPEASLIPMVLAIHSLVSSITKLSIMVAVLGKLNGDGAMWSGFEVISALVALVIVTMYSLSEMSRYMVGALSAAKAFVVFGVALNSMLLPITVLSYISQEGNGFNPGGAIGIIFAMSLIAGAFMGVLSNLTNSSDLIASAGAFIIFAVALAAMTVPLGILIEMAKFSNEELIRAEGLVLTFSGLFGLFALLSGLSSAVDLLATSGSFVIFAGALVVMAKAMQMLAEIPADKLSHAVDEFGYIVLAIGSLITIIMVLTGALQFLGIGWVAPLVIAALALMVGSFALLGFAIAKVLDSMANFSDAMIRFSNADFKNFAKNIKIVIKSIENNLDDMGVVFGKSIKAAAKAIRENAVHVAEAVGVLIAALIEMMAKVVIEMTPAIVELLTGLLDLILQILVVSTVEIIYWLVKAFFAGITAALTAADEEIPALIDALASFLNSLGDALLENGESIHEGCEKITKGIITCLFGTEAAEKMYTDGIVGVLGIALTAASVLPGSLGLAVITLAAALASGIYSALKSELTKAKEGGEIYKDLSGENDREALENAAWNIGFSSARGTREGFKEGSSEAKSVGTTVGENYIDGVSEGTDDSWTIGHSASKDVADGAKSGEYEVKEAGREIGDNLTSGTADGISSGFFKNIAPAIDEMTNNMINQTNENLDIRSPSRVFKSIGEMVGAGFSVGIDESSDEAVSSGTSMGQAVIDSVLGLFGGTDIGKSLSEMFSSSGNIGEMLTGGGLLDGLKDKFSMDNLFDSMGLDTTITPIMDLSNVSSGISDINSMFGSQSLQLSDLNSSLSSSLDVGQLQNGSYDDAKIVASISNLDARMDALASAISSIQIRMDTGALVGSIAGPMDSALGKRAVYAGRGIR